MTQIKIEVPSNDPIALSALGEALQRIATERKGGESIEETFKQAEQTLSTINDLVDDGLLVRPEQLNDSPTREDVERTATDVELKDDTIDTLTSDIGLVRQQTVTPVSDIKQGEPCTESEAEALDDLCGVEDDTLDADGLPWDKRIHSRGKTRLADDTWRLARKPNDKTQEEWDEYVTSVKAELKVVQDIPVPSDTVTPPVVDEQGPFYWSHDESSSCGKVETIEELHEMIPGDGLVTQIDEESYKQRVEAGYDNGEKTPTETLTPPVVETEVVTPPTLDDVQASEPVAAVEPPTSVTAPVTTDNTPSVSTFQELMKYITSDAAKRGATNDMIKEVLAQVDPSLTAIPLIANRADLIPTFVAKLEGRLS